MKTIVIAGGSGLIGRRFVELYEDKYHIKILSRKKHPGKDKTEYYHWDIDAHTLDIEALHADVIINLAGTGIADKRWTKARKKEVINSRIQPIELIGNKLKEAAIKVPLYIGASAIGYYGDRGEEILDENSMSGKGFLAECTVAWEKCANRFSAQYDRLVLLRIGLVLSWKGGALSKILMTSRFGFLNYFGSGSQYYSWIHIDDICGIINRAIEDQQYTGIINAVGPESMTNKTFIKEISKATQTMLRFAVPAFVLKLMLGEMSSVILNSTRVRPTILNNLQYKFQFTNLIDAIKNLKSVKRVD